MADSLISHVDPSLDARVALSDGQRTLTYAELKNQARELADQLMANNSGVVALEGENCIEWVIVDLACQLANLPLLPIATFFAEGQRQFALTNAAVDTLISVGSPAKIQPSKPWHLLPVTTAGITIARQNPKQKSQLPLGTGKITYTSGSTGKPKGVCLSNRQLISQAQALKTAIAQPHNRHLSLFPLALLLENVAGVYATLLAGGTVLLPASQTLGLKGSSGLDVARLCSELSRLQPQTLILMPQLLQALIVACQQGWVPPASFQFMAVGGAKVSRTLITRAHACGLPVYEGYGLSECASVVSLNTPNSQRPGSVGKPLPHLSLNSQEGEILVTGNSFLGYVADPQSWGQDTIATGDLGFVDEDGFLHIDGRLKNQMISSFGRNINPEWLEAELDASPLVEDCMVFGDARPYVCALIYPRKGDASNDRALSDWIAACNSQLPDYAQIKHWHRLDRPFRDHPELITANGKPRREAIAAFFSNTIDRLYKDQQKETQNDVLSKTG